jgi:hypothetical protein
MIYSHNIHYVNSSLFSYFVHTAQDTTQLAWYGGLRRPRLHEAMTRKKRAPFVSPIPPGTTSGVTSTQSNDDQRCPVCSRSVMR